MARKSSLKLRLQLRRLEDAQGEIVEAGSLTSISGNGRNSEFAAPGPGVITPQEVADLYRELIDRYDEARGFLRSCANFGLDPFVVEFQLFPNQASVVQNPVLIDTTSRFSKLCDQFSIAENIVIGAPIDDPATFLWMMWHEEPLTEARNDYTLMRVGEGAQFT
jgi:hypothetical protein